MANLGRRVRARPDGRYDVDLMPHEREALRDLAGQLRDLLLASTDDPSVRRLFPTAYPDDAARDQEYQVLVRDELLARRLAALEVLETTAGADELDEEQLAAWMGSLNDLRLVLGTRIDVDEELPDLDPDDPMAPAYAIYEWLGWILSHVIDAATQRL